MHLRLFYFVCFDYKFELIIMDVEDDKFFGLCKCCLQDGCFRSLWVAYDDNGVLQNYGEMLNECFSLQWPKPKNLHVEQICDDCSKRTSEAYNFRQLVLSSQNQLISSTELPEESEQVLDPVTGDITVIIKEEVRVDYEAKDFQEYEEVEYLEMDEDMLGQNVEAILDEAERDETEEFLEDPDYYPEESDAPAKVQIKRRRKKGERKRPYKNYTNEDFIQCFQAAKTGRMTVAQAAAHYRVPRKTIAARLLDDRRGLPMPTKSIKDDTMIREVRTLLTYTNMTPYKTRTAHYHCAYCPDGPLIEDADTLRLHTRTQHTGERTKAVENFLRPQWLNEILKVDIENLHCTVCCIVLVSWNDMFKHLIEEHDLVFEEAYTRVIPYILKQDLKCALCKEYFSNYHHLDSHMNAHYNNYICSECGDTFLASCRLKKHLKIHEIGRFICDVCGKVFTLDKYRKKHIELVHKHEQKTQCLYCPEKFIGTYSRHLHVMEKHKGKVKSITCELCGKIFDWRPYFLAHVRRSHNNEKNYNCKYCNSRFFMKSELKRHEESHVKKRIKNTCAVQMPKPGKYACNLCGKQYSNKNCLITHFNTHGLELNIDELDSIAESCTIKSDVNAAVNSIKNC